MHRFETLLVDKNEGKDPGSLLKEPIHALLREGAFLLPLQRPQFIEESNHTSQTPKDGGAGARTTPPRALPLTLLALDIEVAPAALKAVDGSRTAAFAESFEPQKAGQRNTKNIAYENGWVKSTLFHGIG